MGLKSLERKTCGRLRQGALENLCGEGGGGRSCGCVRQGALEKLQMKSAAE